MRRLFYFLMVSTFDDSTLSGQQSPGAQGASVADKLVGSWRLISVETMRANGEVIYPFYGKHPEGMLMYDKNGWMSVQIVSDPKPTLPTASSRETFLAAAPADKVNAVDGYCLLREVDRGCVGRNQ